MLTPRASHLPPAQGTPKLTPLWRLGSANRALLPLLHMGKELGRGAYCQVVEATLGQADVGSTAQAMGWVSAVRSPSRDRAAPGAAHDAEPSGRLAVKIYNTGHSADRGGSAMRDVMWEVHVLRQVRHPHVARLLDAIEFTDAVYIVMERYEGPSLEDFIQARSPRD